MCEEGILLIHILFSLLFIFFLFVLDFRLFLFFLSHLTDFLCTWSLLYFVSSLFSSFRMLLHFFHFLFFVFHFFTPSSLHFLLTLPRTLRIQSFVYCVILFFLLPAFRFIFSLSPVHFFPLCSCFLSYIHFSSVKVQIVLGWDMNRWTLISRHSSDVMNTRPISLHIGVLQGWVHLLSLFEPCFMLYWARDAVERVDWKVK